MISLYAQEREFRNSIDFRWKELRDKWRLASAAIEDLLKLEGLRKVTHISNKWS